MPSPWSSLNTAHVTVVSQCIMAPVKKTKVDECCTFQEDKKVKGDLLCLS